MNWYMEYRSSNELSIQDREFLSMFYSSKDFEDYCLRYIPENWFLINSKITFQMILKELRNVGGFNFSRMENSL